MGGASAGRAAVPGGRGLSDLLLLVVAAPQPAGAVPVSVPSSVVRSRAQAQLLSWLSPEPNAGA